MSTFGVGTDRRILADGIRRLLERLHRHELLVARTTKGLQIEMGQEFDRLVSQPVLRATAAGLAGFDDRGPDVLISTDPRLAAMRAEIINAVDFGSDEIRWLLEDRLNELAAEDGEWTERALADTIPTRNEMARVEDAVQRRPYLGQKTEEWFGSFLTFPVKQRVSAWIQQGLNSDLTTDEIVRGLRGTRGSGYTDGILSGQPRHALNALVRTAATHASSTARVEAFEKLGVTRYQWVSTLDSRTSIICANLDGETFKVGEGPLPPAHPNCRSTIVPLYDDDIVGTRAAIDGPVPATTTFEEWLEGRSQQEQNEVLGRTRANAWRRGKITLRQLLGPSLQPLTLAQLRELDRL